MASRNAWYGEWVVIGNRSADFASSKQGSNFADYDVVQKRVLARLYAVVEKCRCDTTQRRDRSENERNHNLKV